MTRHSRVSPLFRLLIAGAVVGAVAGAYPAHVASTTDPSETLKTG